MGIDPSHGLCVYSLIVLYHAFPNSLSQTRNIDRGITSMSAFIPPFSTKYRLGPSPGLPVVQGRSAHVQVW